MIISSLFGDQIQFTCMKIIGIVAAIRSLQSIVIAFLEPDGNWIPWFRGLFLSRGYNSYFIIPIRFFSLYADLGAFLDFSHDRSTKNKTFEERDLVKHGILLDQKFPESSVNCIAGPQ